MLGGFDGGGGLLGGEGGDGGDGGELGGGGGGAAPTHTSSSWIVQLSYEPHKSL